MRSCATCGTAARHDQAFCMRCGAALAPREQGPATPPPRRLDPPTVALPVPPLPPWDAPPLDPRGEQAYDTVGRGGTRAGLAIALALLLVACAGVGGYLLLRSPGGDSRVAAPPAPTSSAGTGRAASPTPGAGSPSSPDPAPSVTRVGPLQVLPVTATVPRQAPDSVDGSGATTSYGPGHLTDADPTTCWRVKGDGAGLTIALALPAPSTLTQVGLINGYAKSDRATGADRYAQERRITRVTWLFSGGQQTQDLADGTRTAQLLTLPGPVATDLLELRIDATTGPGDAALDFTAISGVTVIGSSP